MELTAELKSLFIETAQTLKGHERRIFMAKVAIPETNAILKQGA